MGGGVLFINLGPVLRNPEVYAFFNNSGGLSAACCCCCWSPLLLVQGMDRA